MGSFLDRYFEKVVVKTMLLTMISCFVAGLTLFYLHTVAQEEMLRTEISNRSEAVGNSVVRLLETAIQTGIPFDEMVGMNEFLESNMKNSDELSYIAITNMDGVLFYSSKGFEQSLRGILKRFSLGSYENIEKLPLFEISNKYYDIPLKIKNNTIDEGYLHLGVSKKSMESRINDIYYDILTILFVAMVTGFEFFIFIFRNNVTNSFLDLVSIMKRIISDDYTRTSVKRTKDAVGELIQKLNQLISYTAQNYYQLTKKIEKIKREDASKDDQYHHIQETLIEETDKKTFPSTEMPKQDVLQPVVENLRLPAFLLVLAETILVTILPSYAAQFYVPSLGVSQQFVSGSPVLVFMLFSGIAIPLSNKISYRIGFQKALIVGLVFSTIGYLLAFLTTGLWFLLITRAITAFGYGIAYASCQNYIAAYAPSHKRIQSYAIFAVAFGAAYICGAPIGGILVENVGYNITFFFAALSAIFCIMIAKRYIVDFSNFTLQKKRETNRKPRQLFKNMPLFFSVFFSGLPARMIFSSLICFIYPLYLSHLGNSQSSIGRIVMIFGVVSFAISPFAARIVEKIRFPQVIMILSSFCIAGALFLAAFMDTIAGASISLCIYTIGAVIHTCSMMSMLENISIAEYDNHTKDTILSFYFIFERVGMVSGPAIFSIILAQYDFKLTLLVMASVVMVTTVIFTIYSLFNRSIKNTNVLTGAGA